MKTKLLSFIVFQLLYNFSYAGDSTNEYKLVPNGITSKVLEGQFSSGNTVTYLNPIHSIKNPDIQNKSIPFVSILTSGIQSLLFEYKNYAGEKNIGAYTIFSTGNYNFYNKKILDYANHTLFKNHYLMVCLYRWAFPHYKIAFNTLTIEEQQILWNHLIIADKYLSLVIENKNPGNFNKWLIENKLDPDNKILGFIKRRYDKKQWSNRECRFWIEKIKEDIKTLMKNPDQSASHYQIIQHVSDSISIAVNHAGKFLFLNGDNHPITGRTYLYMTLNHPNIKAYYGKWEDDTIYYSIDNKSIRTKDSILQKHDWLNYFPVKENIIAYKNKIHMGLYDIKDNRIILDSCTEIQILENNHYLAIKKIVSYQADSSLLNKEESKYDIYGNPLKIGDIISSETEFQLYQSDGNKISNEALKYINPLYFDNDGNSKMHHRFQIYFLDGGKFILFKNTQDKWGIIDQAGEIKFSFDYDQIQVTNHPLSLTLIKIDSEGKRQAENVILK